VVTNPASSLAQGRESLPAETSVLTTMLRRDVVLGGYLLDVLGTGIDIFKNLLKTFVLNGYCG